MGKLLGGLTKFGMVLLVACLSLTLVACGDDDNDSPPLTVEADAFNGGLVWDNWTTTDAGGSGELPAGAVNKDFVRCKACHGWDAKGLAGGYVHRTATDTRPNPEPGVDLTAADATLTLEAVFNPGGRAFSLENQQMPDYDTGDGLTLQQAEDVLAFLLNGPKIGDFADLDTTVEPVAYTFNNVDMVNGEGLYGSQCQGCHGAATATTQTATGPPLGSYFVSDGKYSEGFHKSVYGIPGSSMTRTGLGELSGPEVADILAYIQSRLELPGDAFAGGLAWDNWTTTDAGGTGSLPTGAVNTDFVRCKACHGWDAKGLAGGYVRRTATDTRPNPEPGVDLTAADATLTLEAILNSGGRALNAESQVMPDYDTAEGLTLDQADNLLKFLVSGPKIGDYADIDTTADPVAYSFKNVDTVNGEGLYGSQCQGCHGAATATTQTATGPPLGSYFVSDGKYSEGFHKSVYGIPGTIMTRTAMGELSGQEVADIHAYIQQALDSGSTPTPPPTTPDGATLFSACTGCHGADGASGFAPDISAKTAAGLQAAPAGQSAHTTANDWTLAEAQAVVDFLATQ